MKQKDLVNGLSLNQTQISSDMIDNSIKINTLPSNSVAERRTPLHSHYLHIKNEGSIKSTLRLLNNSIKSEEKAKLKVIKKYDNLPNKPAFGCSQNRKLNIFQGNHETSEKTNSNPKLAIISQINSTLSTSECPKLQNNNTNKIIRNSQRIKTKLGFGVSSHIQRVPSMDVIYKARGPGPGQYKLPEASNYATKNHDTKEERKNYFSSAINRIPIQDRLLKQMKDRESSCQNIQLRVKSPGPGSYNLPCLSSPKQDYLARQKWKKVNKKKKKKIQQILQSLNSQRAKKEANLIEINKFKQHIHRYPNNQEQISKNNIKSHRQPMSIIENKNQYLRNQLRDKTNKYLPTISQTNLQHQNRGPIYKHLISNCFVLKNDHAFQAHYYQQPQKQSQYIFIKAKTPQNFKYKFHC